MARIPLQSLVSARQAGAQLNPGVFQQAAQANINLLSSIDGAAQMVKEQFDRAQDLRNQSEISEKTRTIRDAQGTFQNAMVAGRVDPALWGGLWAERLKKLPGELKLDSSKTPPAVRRAVVENFDNFASSSFIQISGAALKENLQRAKQNFSRDLQYNYEMENFAGNEKLIEENRAVLGDDLADDALKINRLKERDVGILGSREGDLIAHIENAKAGKLGLPKVQNQQELEISERLLKQKESEGVTGIQKLVELGYIEDEADLKSQLDSDPHISKLTKEAVIKNYNETKPLTDVERYRLIDAVNALTPLRYTEEYEDEYYKVLKEFEALGQRKNKPRVDIYNLYPDRFSVERGKKLSMEQQAEDKKPLMYVADNLIKERAEGIVNTAYNKGKIIEPTDGVQLATNAATRQRLEEEMVVVRKALSDSLMGYIYSFPKGEKPTEVDLKKFMDATANQTILDTRRRLRSSNPYAVPGGDTVGEYSNPEQTGADRSKALMDAWLDTSNTPLLPAPGDYNPPE